ncbi:MAG TPA: hypothetical protein VL981_08190 [Candidatus Methylacidiphilales bacterium]|nr:hypothetical protein [Candidatus Methylacidiphilales bacterium]
MVRYIFLLVIWILMGGITFGILFYQEENWRGARDWAACQKELQAKGETLNLRQLAPSGKPENDLTKVPIFAELFQKEYTAARLYKFCYFGPYLENSGNQDLLKNSNVYLTEGKPLNLASWQKYYRSSPESRLPQQVGSPAQDVLAELSHFDPELGEIDSALHNPESYWPPDCFMPYPPSFRMDRIDGFIRTYDAYQVAGEVLQMRGVAHLENGESEKAEQDFLFIQRLARSILRAPSILGELMAGGIQERGEGLLWEGVRRHAWNDAELSDMETSMVSVDFLKSYREALRFERGASIQCLSYAEQKQPIPVSYPPGKEYKLDQMALFLDLAPQGKIDQAKSYFCREIQKEIEAIDLNRGMLDASLFAKDKKSLMVSLLPFLGSLQGLNGAAHHVAESETFLRMGRVACFLERFYLKQGRYPESLAELSDLPPRLNQEALSERPLHYQRKGNGYLLYSVGWDRIDHGGVPTGSRVENGETVSNADYDWVWPSP